MQWTGWIGLAIGICAVPVSAVPASKMGPPPVVLDLGPVVPTPAPTPKAAAKKRLITTITVQNNTEGETVISFEATDFADEGEGKKHTLAAKTYSLAEQKSETKELAEAILRQVRALEGDMLNFVEKAGPPKERAPLGPGEGGSRPYR